MFSFSYLDRSAVDTFRADVNVITMLPYCQSRTRGELSRFCVSMEHRRMYCLAR